jgi:hypothetical protein
VARKTVPAHRSGELSLDNAFDLIEGHPTKASRFGKSLTGPPATHFMVYCGQRVGHPALF